MVSVLYTDVDETLTGPRGDLLADAEGKNTLVAVQALLEARAGGIEVVPCSGRNRKRLGDTARLLGLSSYLAELGSVRVRNGGADVSYERGDCPGDGPPAEHLWPVAEQLVAAFPDHIEIAHPWNEDREVSILVRGEIAYDDARAWFDDNGFAWVDLHDNGRYKRGRGGLEHLEMIHMYHVSPRGVSKARSIEHDVAARGLRAADVAYIGDAPSDLAVAPYVGRLFIVANGVEAHPALSNAISDFNNVTVTTGRNGAGFAECVDTLLAKRNEQ